MPTARIVVLAMVVMVTAREVMAAAAKVSGTHPNNGSFEKHLNQVRQPEPSHVARLFKSQHKKMLGRQWYSTSFLFGLLLSILICSKIHATMSYHPQQSCLFQCQGACPTPPRDLSLCQ